MEVLPLESEEIEMNDRVLTGMRTTGNLHLGHYVGALKMWLSAQDSGADCYFLLADVQALTTHVDKPELIRESVRQVVLDWLSVGLDPSRPNVHFVLQSGVKSRFEMSQYFMMLATLSEIERNPTVKDELRNNSNPSMGFMTYPVDQTADIYMVSPTPGEGRLLVPVGEDQVPHLEYSRVLARRFNHLYGVNLFVPCEPRVGEVGRLVGIDGNDKMSKSKGNTIDLCDTSEEVARKVMKMYTDPNRLRATDPGRVEGNPLFIYLEAFLSDVDELSEYQRLYRIGGIGDVVLKKRLAEGLNLLLEPMRQRRADMERADVYEMVYAGTQETNVIADRVLGEMKQAMCLIVN
jgi:tryptophanyl-tRNA synthetase